MQSTAAVAVLLLCAATTAAAERGPSITCESRNNATTHCRVPGGGPVRIDVVLSDAPCIEDRSWSRTSTGIEVSDGCRAIFETTAEEPEPPNRNTYIDLVDTDAAMARATLIERGYSPVRSEAGDRDGEQRHYFRTPQRPACLRVTQRGGNYRDLDGVAAVECR
jgi:hypothetical protein